MVSRETVCVSRLEGLDLEQPGHPVCIARLIYDALRAEHRAANRKKNSTTLSLSLSLSLSLYQLVVGIKVLLNWQSGSDQGQPRSGPAVAGWLCREQIRRNHSCLARSVLG